MATDPVTPVTRPDGETDYLCRIPAELVDQHQDWSEVAAFRFEKVSDTEVVLWLTNDLERATDPDQA